MYFTVIGVGSDGTKLCMYGTCHDSWKEAYQKVIEEFADGETPSMEYFGEYRVLAFGDKVFIITKDKSGNRTKVFQ